MVAVYGQPSATTPNSTDGTANGARRPRRPEQNIPLDPSPDYDASDELEFGINWLPWILRGVYPPPGNPPQ